MPIISNASQSGPGRCPPRAVRGGTRLGGAERMLGWPSDGMDEAWRGVAQALDHCKQGTNKWTPSGPVTVSLHREL